MILEANEPIAPLDGSRRNVCPYCGKLVAEYPCVYWRTLSEVGSLFLHRECAREWGMHLIGDGMAIYTHRTKVER